MIILSLSSLFSLLKSPFFSVSLPFFIFSLSHRLSLSLSV